MNLILQPGDLADLPCTPARLFERNAPLAMEIGFGGGHFLEHLTQTRPTWNVLGVELSVGSMARAYERLHRKTASSHVHLFHGDGGFVVRDVLPPGSLHRVYINFPSPWPKKKHRHRRLLRASFFSLLAARLAPGGVLHLTTDHHRYFRFAVRAARTTGLYRIRFTPPPHATLGTKYARRWQRQGKTIRHAAFCPRRPPALSFSSVLSKAPVHHAILKGDLPPLDRFNKLVRRFEGGTVVVLKAYRAVDDEGYLFLTLVEEDRLRQKVLIEARPSDKGVFVGLKAFGGALSTEGTSAAVEHVTGWLCKEHGLEVEETLY